MNEKTSTPIAPKQLPPGLPSRWAQCPKTWCKAHKDCGDPGYCVSDAQYALSETVPTDVPEVLAEHGGGDRREWHSQGAWLYPGDRIIVQRAPTQAGERATLAADLVQANAPESEAHQGDTPRTDEAVVTYMVDTEDNQYFVADENNAQAVEDLTNHQEATMTPLVPGDFARTLEREVAHYKLLADMQRENQEHAEDEVEALKHDIERHIQIANDYLNNAMRGDFIMSRMVHQRSGAHVGWTLDEIYAGDDPESAIDRARTSGGKS